MRFQFFLDFTTLPYNEQQNNNNNNNKLNYTLDEDICKCAKKENASSTFQLI
jgi:hypothetical protein